MKKRNKKTCDISQYKKEEYQLKIKAILLLSNIYNFPLDVTECTLLGDLFIGEFFVTEYYP
jgi:hypothetical protein